MATMRRYVRPAETDSPDSRRSHGMKFPRVNRTLLSFAIALSAVIVPTLLQSAILYLTDGSEIKGEVVSFEGDTLVFDPSFGGRIRVPRKNIARLVFDESEEPGPAPSAKQDEQAGRGDIAVVFKQDKLTSKIAVSRKTKSAEEELERANWIQQLLIVDRDTVYSRIDTTLEKTIYKGHEKELKNSIRLEDIKATVEAGVHNCTVIVRNLGATEYESQFREGPIDLRLQFETVVVYAGHTTTLQVGISKGFMRMGDPNLIKVQ
jgi:hypothetical protein